MSSRSRGEIRKINFAKGLRKKKLLSSIMHGDPNYYKHDGQYIKGKIHCSCPLCSAKTNNRGRYGVAKNYKHSDLQKLDSMKYQEKEFYSGNEGENT